MYWGNPERKGLSMHFQWASDDRWSRPACVKWAWLMLKLRHIYQQDYQCRTFGNLNDLR